jgi:hypothetical protein
MTEPISKKEVLELAISAVADREETYDSPSNNFKRIANLWRIHLHNRYGEKYNHALPILDAADVAMMMTLMKLARLEHDPTSLDQWVDIAGYAACGANIMVRR